MASLLRHLNTTILGEHLRYHITPLLNMVHRRKHRKIAISLLTPKAIQTYAHVLDYEAHVLVRSLFQDGKQGSLPINPAKYAGRYVLKYV